MALEKNFKQIVITTALKPDFARISTHKLKARASKSL